MLKSYADETTGGEPPSRRLAASRVLARFGVQFVGRTWRNCLNSILPNSNAACRPPTRASSTNWAGCAPAAPARACSNRCSVEAYGQRMPISQVATISVPEPRALSVSVWDKSMVHAVDKAIRDANLGLSPTVEGAILRIRIPELNEQRRKEMVKIAHKYSEDARVAVRHVRRDGLDVLKKLLKEHAISEDDEKHHQAEVQKATDQAIHEIDASLAAKEKEIMQV